MRLDRATAAGSVVSGVLASVCCIGPLVFAVLGISGVTLAQKFEPLRPYFLLLTYGLLGGAFYFSYRPQKAVCGPGGACERPRLSRLGRAGLWLAAIAVVLATSFPWYAEYLF
jgi:mercuric ion transport protein